MRQYAWYSPEIDTIVLQTIMEGCTIAFEWSFYNMSEEIFNRLTSAIEEDSKLDPLQIYLWFPLGEL